MSFGSSGNRGGRFHSGLMPDINVTPFVDVMLVLLVIFMVTAPMMTAGVNVDLPETQAKPLPGQDEPLTITVTANGKVYLNKTEMKVEELEAKLVAITGQKRDTRIFVRGDKAVDYGRVMQVVGQINTAGFNKVSLVTEQSAPAAAKDKG